MTTSDLPDRPRSVTLSLPREAQWTLHDVLLYRIEHGTTTTTPTRIDPPPVELFQAFETLDDGENRFTIAQLEAIQTVLMQYHHSTTRWELERAQIERLLHHVAVHLDPHQATHCTE